MIIAVAAITAVAILVVQLVVSDLHRVSGTHVRRVHKGVWSGLALTWAAVLVLLVPRVVGLIT